MTNKALEKLDGENKSFKGGKKEQAMKSAVLATLKNFCCQNEEFAQAVVQSSKTFSDCLKAVAAGTGTSISDLEAYKKAVQFYFPGADIKCTMTIDLIGAAASDTPPITMSSAPVKKSVLNMSLDDLF
ncbi:MAG: hypothetical protein MRZ61_09570 [Oscillospiraceae bacterium]|nr:hypothetical protein [Oscillospiraceae bacterium]